MKIKPTVIKSLLCVLLLVFAVLAATACDPHTHAWSEWTVTKAPTCTEAGEQTRTCSTCDVKENQPVNALGHSYSAAWTWEGDEAATLTLTCAHDKSHTKEVSATVTQETEVLPTCETAGSALYIANATVDGSSYSDRKEKKSDPLGHSYDPANLAWTWDGTDAVATLTCANDASHQKSFTATVTEQVGKNPTCGAPGEKCYTATVEIDGVAYENVKKEEIPTLPHSYAPETLVWEWNGYESAVAVLTCSNSAEHKQSISATLTCSDLKTPDCVSDGVRIHTATVEIDDVIYTAERAEVLSASGHSYSEAGINWNQITGEAPTATAACKHKCGHTVILTPTVTSEVTLAPACEAEGIRTYTATVILEGVTYTHEETEAIEKTGHDWDAGTVNKEPTATESGIRTYTCLTCSATKTEVIYAEDNAEWNAAFEKAENAENFTVQILYNGNGYLLLVDGKKLKTTSFPEEVTYYYDEIDGLAYRYSMGYAEGGTAEWELDISDELFEVRFPDQFFPRECWDALKSASAEFSYDAATHTYFSESFTVGDSDTALANFALVIEDGTLTEMRYHVCEDGAVSAFGVLNLSDYGTTEVAFPHVHAWSDWTVTENPTCTETGTREKSCACGEKRTEVLPAAHDYGADGVCTRCGEGCSVGLAYELNEDGDGYTVTGIGSCRDSELIIPPMYQGLPVTAIGADAFFGCRSVTAIALPHTLKEIELNAFMFSSIASIHIPAGVVHIDSYAFSSCDALTEITVDAANETYMAIDGHLYTKDGVMVAYASGCRDTSFTVPAGITSIRVSAFYGCNYLETLVIGEDVEWISFWAIAWCENIKSIEISASVAWIGDYFLYNSDQLSSITVDPASEHYKTVDGVLFTKDGKTLVRYPGASSATTYEIPDGTVFIADGAVGGAEKLLSVRLPDSVEYIGEGAFYGCYRLYEDVVDGVYYLNNWVIGFDGTAENAVVRDGTVGISNGSLSGSDIVSVVIPSSVRYINERAIWSEKLECITFENTSGWEIFGYGESEGTPVDVTDPEANANLWMRTYYSYNFKCTSAHTHMWSAWTVTENPTCTKEGKRTRSCSSCGETETETVATLPHAEVALPGKEASCKESGLTEGVKCSACGEVLHAQTEIPRLSCSYVSTVTPPVCGTDGYTTHTCSMCGDSYVDSYVEATEDHQWGAWKVLDGRTVRTCASACGAEQSVTSISASYRGITLLTGETASKDDVTVWATLSDASVIELGDFSLENDVMTADGENTVTVRFHAAATTVAVPAIYGNLPGTTSADEFTYTQANGEITITGFVGTSVEIVIPAHINRVPVRYIGDSAFDGNQTITSVTVAPSVKCIGTYSFREVQCLTEIVLHEGLEIILGGAFMRTPITELVIPDTVKTIEVCFEWDGDPVDGAFENCDKLTSVILGDGLDMIAPRTFYGCTDLITAVIGDGVTNIGWYAFAECCRLTDVSLGKGVLTVGAYAFHNCEELFSVEIPGNVKSIGSYAFYGCIHLKTVTLNEGLKSIAGGAFMECPIKELVIPDTVETIEVCFEWDGDPVDGAFENCDKLTSVILGDGLGEIAARTFYGCDMLTSVVIGDGVTSIGRVAFAECYNLLEVTVGDSVLTVGAYAFQNCEELPFIEIPSNVESIGEYCFYGCGRLKEVILNEGLKSIAGGAFMECPIKELVIPDTVETVEVCYNWEGVPMDGAFENCDKLTSVILGDGLGEIAARTFYGCDMLASVVIGDRVASIGENAFAECCNLLEVTVGRAVVSIGHSAFYACVELPFIEFPTALKTIGTYAFKDCERLETVNFNEGLRSIGGGAFMNTAIMYLEIPDTVETIEVCFEWDGDPVDGAFENCDMLTNAILGDRLGAIAQRTFYDCNELHTVVIGNRAESIGAYAFFGCNNLTNLTIGESVMSIGASAFAACISLPSVEIPADVETIGECCFSGCVSLETLILKNGLKRIDGAAFMHTAIRELVIPNTVETIESCYNWEGKPEYGAFENCDMLTSVILGTRLTAIPGRCFFECDSLVKVEIGDRVESIGEYAFYGCAELAELTLGEGVITIGNYAFSHCHNLPSVEIPESVESIGVYCFSDCWMLETVILKEGLKSIGGGAFASTAIRELVIPDTVTAIEACYRWDGTPSLGAFENCDKLTKVVIGSKLAKIEGRTFFGCSSLTEVSIGERVTSIGQLAFGDCTSLEYIYIPANVKSVYSSAFDGCEGIEIEYESKA